MATYVLVHGGAHGGWCYQRPARLLRELGHDVYTPTLTGLGERAHLLSADVDLNMHITDVVNLLRYEDLRDVILVGHSYGGMVITGVADRVADRVGRLVYLDAANPKSGQSLSEADGGGIARTRAYAQVINGVEVVLAPDSTPATFYGVSDPHVVKWMAERLTGHPWKCFEQRLELRDERALEAIPRYHIICTSTLAHRRSNTPDVIAQAERENRLWQIDTGHDLMITEPVVVADVLNSIGSA